jgi:hypothetical protein
VSISTRPHIARALKRKTSQCPAVRVAISLVCERRVLRAMHVLHLWGCSDSGFTACARLRTTIMETSVTRRLHSRRLVVC